MVKDIRKNVAAFVKSGLGEVMEPISRVEKELREMLEKMSAQKISRDEIRNWVIEMLARVGEARSEVEKGIELGLAKTFATLNIPTRSEVDALAKNVNKLTSEVRKLAATGVSAAKKAPAAKPAAKKPVAKKAVIKKPAPKAPAKSVKKAPAAKKPGRKS